MGQAFAYSTDISEVFNLLPWSEKLSDAQRDEFVAAVSFLVDRDDELQAYTSGVLTGQSNSEIVTATTGGVVITFPRPFRRVPTVVACIGDTASGAILSIENSSITTAVFEVRIYDAAGVEQNGSPFRVNWIATI